ncbi:MAG TPA: hypothetical protein VNL69_03530, partial [Bacteroidota bacterium]|nr:hypothetical protein [Bacteroidota bacterium]
MRRRWIAFIEYALWIAVCVGFVAFMGGPSTDPLPAGTIKKQFPTLPMQTLSQGEEAWDKNLTLPK